MSLVVKDLVKSYGSKVVVNHLNFALEKPGVYALLGTNGAGKTTSLRIILGMLAKDSGEILWKGSPLDISKVNIGYLAEERGLYPKFSLMDQLLYFADLKNVPKAEAIKRINHWAKRLDVFDYLYPPKTGKRAPKPMLADQLSKGNQQKIQLMAALISDPELIVLDEPLSGLDPVNSDLFKDIIKDEIAKGKFLIMSSHQMATIEEFCEDITILNKGDVVLQGNLNQIKKGYGRVNMLIKCEEDIASYIEEFQFTVENHTPDGYQLKISSEEAAAAFLKRLISEQITVIRYELREPSLHEIFVEKVGENHGEK